MKNIVIFGSGGHAKVVIDIIEKSNVYNILGLIDNFKTIGTMVYGYEVLGDETYIYKVQELVVGGIVAVGDNWNRSMFVNRILMADPKFNFITAIHPNASIAKGVRIGKGTVIMAGSIINSDTTVGEHCIINTKASIDHDSQIGDFVSIAPNATTGGNVVVGNHCTLSLGANIIHSKRIGEHTVIGAGATVLHDIGCYSVAFGTPAKVIKSREPADSYL